MNKNAIIGVVIFIFVGLFAAFVYPGFLHHKQERKILYWTDPMIPGDKSDHAGKSPMGMDRVPVYADEATSDTGQRIAMQTYYTCPMHPSVISDKPGACPVCGMVLVKKTGPVELPKTELESLQAVTLSPTQRVLANVQTVPAKRQTLEKDVNAVGVVDVAEPLQATVSARFRGRIERLYVNFTGETVQAGQALFELYSPDLVSAQQDLLLASEALRNAKASQDQQNVEMQNRLSSAAKERLKIHFGMAESQIEEIEKRGDVQSTQKYFSPIKGTVTLKEVQQGQYVDEGTVLYQLVDLSKVWIYLDVYEKDLAFVKVGQTVSITADAYAGHVLTGRVTFIDPVVVSETRTARVRTEFPNPDGLLKPNMFVKAQILVPAANALLVPYGAVLFTGKTSVVWVEIKPNTFEPRRVTVGRSSDSFYEIIDGIREGEMVAASGGFLIDSESSLRQPVTTKTADEKKHEH